MAIKVHSPASPASDANAKAASPAAADHPRPYVDADGVERPSTPTGADLKKTPEKGAGGSAESSSAEKSSERGQPRSLHASLEGQQVSNPGDDIAAAAASLRPREPAPAPPPAEVGTPDHRAMLRPVPRSPGSFGGYVPPPPNTLVLYTTSLRVVRKAHYESTLVRGRSRREARPFSCPRSSGSFSVLSTSSLCFARWAVERAANVWPWLDWSLNPHLCGPSLSPHRAAGEGPPRHVLLRVRRARRVDVAAVPGRTQGAEGTGRSPGAASHH